MTIFGIPLITSYLITSLLINSSMGQENHLSGFYSENTLYHNTCVIRDRLSQGRLTETLSLINENLEKRNPDIYSVYTGYLCLYKALVFQKRGRYSLSRYYSTISREYGRWFQDNDLYLHSVNLSGVLELLSNNDESAQLIFNQLLSESIKFKNKLFIETALRNLLALSIRNHNSTSIPELIERLGYINNGNLEHDQLRLLGLSLEITSGPEDATNIFKLALETSFSSRVEPYQKALSCFFLARNQKKLKNNEQSIKLYKECKELLEEVDHDRILTSYDSGLYKTVYLDCLIDLGILYIEASKLIDGYEIFHSIIGEIQFLAHSITSDENRFIISDKAKRAYNYGILVALKLYENSKDEKFLFQAFNWSLQSKSLSLNSLFEREEFFYQIGIPDTIISYQKENKKRLDLIYKKLNNNVELRLIDSIYNQSRKIEQAEEIIVTHFEDLKRKTDKADLFKLLKKQLKPKEIYLGYQDLDSCFAMFKVEKGKLTYKLIPANRALRENIKYFKTEISSNPNNLYSNDKERYLEILKNDLFKLLIHDSYKINKLVIHPDGVLLGVPFETLLVSGVDQTNNNQVKNRNICREVRYLTMPFLSLSKKIKLKNQLLILSCDSRSGQQNQFSEVDRISKLFIKSSTLNLDQGALSENSLDPAKYIHIAGHALVNFKKPLQTEMVCLPGLKGISIDEILGYQLSGTNVYLNTCASGNGPLNQGEGLLSLGFAFALAGSRTIIQNLWEASDLSASMIAQYYYKYLRFNRPEKALMKAKRKYLRNCPPGMDHPFYWAGVVCYTQKESAKGHWIVIFGFCLLGIGIGLGYLSIRKRILR